jgi:hypothetical protein
VPDVLAKRPFRETSRSGWSKLYIPVKYKLKDCTMMKKFMTSEALSKVKKPMGDPGRKGMTPFPGEAAIMTIYS